LLENWKHYSKWTVSRRPSRFHDIKTLVRSSPPKLTLEVFASLNLGFALTAFIFYNVPLRYRRTSVRLDSYLNKLFHITQTDLLKEYWSFFLLGLALSVVIWVLVRLFSRTGATLHATVGWFAICVCPAWYVFEMSLSDYRLGINWGLFRHFENYEFAAAVVCLLLYTKGRWHVPVLIGGLLILGHCAFWLWEFRFFARELWLGWGGDAAVLPIFGLLAAISWAHYERRA
jgi:hypothetical protein